MRDILAAIVRHGTDRPDAVALQDACGTVCYGELVQRVGGLARRLRDAPSVIGIGGASSVGWAVVDLAMAASGRTAVPLPLLVAG